MDLPESLVQCLASLHMALLGSAMHCVCVAKSRAEEATTATTWYRPLASSFFDLQGAVLLATSLMSSARPSDILDHNHHSLEIDALLSGVHECTRGLVADHLHNSL